MEKQKTKRREWVKTAAIVFLSVLLVLTFFSNTIMNRSLPEVAAQYVSSGSINARIRGTGQVSANESYDVTLSQTRKIRSVMVKVGQQVTAGDTLFILEADESDELKQAQKTLEDMELNYQKSLITLSNGSSTEDRGVQKLRDAYEDALRIYRLYSNADPSQVEVSLKKAEQELKELQREQERLQKIYDKSIKAVSEADAKISAAEDEIDLLYKELNNVLTFDRLHRVLVSMQIDDLNNRITDNERQLAEKQTAAISAQDALDKYLNENTEFVSDGKPMKRSDLNREYLRYTDDDDEYIVKQYASDAKTFRDYIIWKFYIPDQDSFTIEYTQALIDTHKEIIKLTDKQTEAENDLNALNNQIQADKEDIYTLQKILVELDKINSAESEKEAALEGWNGNIDSLEDEIERIGLAVDEQSAIVENFQTANTAGSALKAAQEALEDAVFQANLGSTDSLDIQAAKKAIEEQKKVVEELTQQADGQEVVANVSGTISAINVTAGNTAGAETALATITVADRGYTVKISVTTEQARQVRVGDTAQITNYYWGDISATLENIASDPQSMGKNKLLIFRISGDGVEAGTNLTLSIGQKSANYDCLVPNSAIRSDSNGSFVLVVTAKSSPLGNRYVATRADIQVLASDDTMSAVSGLANGDFVITTSTKPLEAGNQVRLVDNG